MVGNARVDGAVGMGASTHMARAKHKTTAAAHMRVVLSSRHALARTCARGGLGGREWRLAATGWAGHKARLACE